MGRRVNLADLASDDLDVAAPAASRQLLDQAGSVGAAGLVVPISSVTFNPLNKRPGGDDDELAELAETIREHGVIQPLVVCSTTAYLAEFPEQRGPVDGADWVVLIGNRRLRAARVAELERVTILVNDEKITSMYEVMLVENGQRRELPPLSEAEAMMEALRATSISQRELARRVGKSHMYIRQRLALLKLIPPLRSALELGELTIERAREFGELPEPEQETIVAAGKPYRGLPANGKRAGTRGRSIRISTPAAAAASIRKAFDDEELLELVRLLSTPPASSDSG